MNLTELRQMQQTLQQGIAGDAGDAVRAIALLRPRPGGGAPALQVYRQAHGARLAAALADNHAVLVLALGDEGFARLAAAYVAAQPSLTPSIRWFGHRLAEFMDQAGADLVPHPALADLARMDWALRAAFDAGDAQVLGRDELLGLAAADWPALRFDLHPSVQRRALRWAVEPVWQALDAAEPGAEPDLPEPVAQAHTLLVWRQGLATRWRSLSETEAGLLQALDQGADFAALCAQAGDAATAAGLLAQWLADGLLSAALPQRADPG
ncbi:MAG: putative DNA-binding domain-containing protein [Burkholderiaceae bacterium]|nr:putative DNA-binding domain-containing protein [Burkholderiaceae bacterium]